MLTFNAGESGCGATRLTGGGWARLELPHEGERKDVGGILVGFAACADYCVMIVRCKYM